MSSLNKAMIIGRLGQDPDIRATQNGTQVANMSVATSERYKDKDGNKQETTEWHKVVAWARLAEICRDYLKKGSQVYFEGSLQTNEWEDKDGNKRYTTEIKALNMVMLDSKADSTNNPKPDKGTKDHNGNYVIGSQSNASKNNKDESDDDLPF